MDADLLTSQFLILHVNLAGRIVPHQNHRKTGRNALSLHPLNPERQFLTEFCGHRLAVQQLCRHSSSLPSAFRSIVHLRTQKLRANPRRTYGIIAAVFRATEINVYAPIQLSYPRRYHLPEQC